MILGPATVITSNLAIPSTQVNEFDIGIYNCTARGYPKPVITWMSNGQIINPTVLTLSEAYDTGLWIVTNEISLTMTTAYSGLLGCFASNGIGPTNNKTTKIIMQCEYF